MSTPDTAATIRANLVAQRELRGFTQAELGARASVAPAAISHFETGQRVPSVESLLKLANALSVSVDLLLGRGADDSSARLDPVFVRASRADAGTLETLRRVTTALLDEAESRRK